MLLKSCKYPVFTSQIIRRATVKLGSRCVPAVHTRCIARTRIPTPHGPVFLHLYHNNVDSKEHLAIVIDPAQLLVRGAYTGRLTSDIQIPSSSPGSSIFTPSPDIPIPPLVCIHSECYTGETIGSMRCDCGEQLDEALRQIALPIPVVESPSGTFHTIPGRGVVIYMRQEGRGIGLASKLRAYNLQDMGHDTVAANLILGHGADERGYEVAGLGIRLLTNNPDKVQALTAQGINILERISMVPRSWQHNHSDEQNGVTSGEELNKYIKTEVEKMGHMLHLPASL
ncbi:GTP cyclohydrolase II [Mycena rosella]|uniref:GTP cyclohydrolase II n=1 Tax=Mycena rosella TaxID=1033263 RepID=A0AAD7GSE6_MYCRO|nr:GTP cyclohydrolase II [Mycena rosella]